MSDPTIDRLTCSARSAATEAAHVFESAGVVVLKDVLPDRVIAPVTKLLNRALTEMRPLFRRYSIPPGPPAVTGAAIDALMRGRNAEIRPEDRHVLLGHFPLAVRLDPALQAIPLYLRDLPALHHFLGSRDLFVHMPPTARFVLPGNRHAAVPTHQDVSYNKHLGRFCVMWVPLTAIDERCGGMAVYTGTQGIGEVFRGPQVAATNGWLDPVDATDHERLVLAPLSPGDIVVIGDETIHESIANTSDRCRLSIDFRIFGAHSHSTKHYLDLQTGRVIAPQDPQRDAS